MPILLIGNLSIKIRKNTISLKEIAFLNFYKYIL